MNKRIHRLFCFSERVLAGLWEVCCVLDGATSSADSAMLICERYVLITPWLRFVYVSAVIK